MDHTLQLNIRLTDEELDRIARRVLETLQGAGVVPKPGGRLITLPDWPQHHDWPSPRSLRQMIFKREQNGMEASGCIARVGRRVLINEDKFWAWARDGKKF